ncbi:MAG: hypothetical protein V1716_01785 [Candidatus Uhrbacteria bacterium]
MSQSLSQLITDLSTFPELDLATLEKLFGLSFTKTANQNEYFDFFLDADNNIELRIDKNDVRRKILIFEIEPAENFSEDMIISEYPTAEPNSHSPNDPTYKSLTLSKPWGKISFGFNSDDVLTSLVFDSTKL